MRLIPSDPDVRTIVERIRDGTLDLQPDFQRGEVWSIAKKRKLVDSILREWHVPPIHVIEAPDGREEVLDGQQRLAAIRDFCNGIFPVNGDAEPRDQEIAQLDGLRYESLPDRWRRKFDRFSIRFFRIVDHQPGEPAELFFRLNQPTSLTAAEQRNAFFGAARQQVKALVDGMEKLGLTAAKIGFSNSRMAHDDLLARVCCSAEAGTLRNKVTAKLIEEKYRSRGGFSSSAITRVQGGLEFLAKVSDDLSWSVRFNKATLYSWLMFSLVCHSSASADPLVTRRYMHAFEYSRMGAPQGELAACAALLRIFNDRATSRVADVSSVLIRDFVIWTSLVSWVHQDHAALFSDLRQVRMARDLLPVVRDSIADDSLDSGIEVIVSGWGDLS